MSAKRRANRTNPVTPRPGRLVRVVEHVGRLVPI
jgi:hypothetical protein